MKNICFYFTYLAESKALLWNRCFNELAHENRCFSYVLFDKKNEFNIFNRFELDKTFPKIMKVGSEDINSLSDQKKNEILDRYEKYNIQQLRFHDFRKDELLISYSFIDLTCAYIKKYEDFLIENEIDILFYMEPLSFNVTANAIIMEMVCNQLGKKVRFAARIGGWTNVGIFDNLHRSSDKIDRLYKKNLKEGLSSKEEKRVMDYFMAYSEFKDSEFAKSIIYKKTLNKKFSIKSLIRRIYYIVKNIFSKKIIDTKHLYDEYDIFNNKYILFLPNKVRNKRARYMSPFYSNQLAIIENLLISLPSSHSLVVKDHPHSMARNYGINYKTLDESMVNLVKSSNNSFYIDPSISTFEAIENADIVISVASTSAIEALIKFKHVIMFGKKLFTFGEYDAPIKRVTNIEDLPQILNSCINSPPPKKEIIAYLHSLLFHTYRPGDVQDDEDWTNFTDEGFDEKRAKFIKIAIKLAMGNE